MENFTVYTREILSNSKIKNEKIQKFQRRLKPVRASDVEIFAGEEWLDGGAVKAPDWLPLQLSK